MHGDGSGPRIVALDTGIKTSIVRNFVARGATLELLPCTTPAEEVFARGADGIFLVPGPGDPATLGYLVDTVRQAIGRMPVFGICLGHQILSQAVGLETFKLPFGHRGGNHPVKDLRTGRIAITAQNHGFAVRGEAGQRLQTDFGEAELTHVNLYDGTIEGIRLLDVPAGCVQYHPEAGPGPHDSVGLFDEFIAGDRGRACRRRDDLHKILVLGSGPIVIGQAAEFDYSGAQACKVLLEEGYEVVLVNSNPATIMTDPEFATATYVEPLLPEVVAQVIERERPDALLPTLGGQTALNLAKALYEDGTLERFGVELIGATYDAINRAEDRELFDATMQAAGLRTARNTIATSVDAGARARSAELRAAADHPPGVHARRPRRRHRPHRGGVRADRRPGPRRVADRPGADRRVGARLGRVRARGHARRRGQRRDRLLDRERRPDGRPHRRLGDGRAADVADRPPVPAAARPGDRGDPRGRGRDGRLQRPVRGQPGDRRDRRDRDEPARLALLGAGLEGDRLPDREDRRAPGGRLPARRDPERHHAQDAGVVRADDRLRGRQVAALRVREVPRRRRPALDAHEVRRRGDGDRAHVQAGVRQGDALARARHARRPRGRRARAARVPGRRPLRPRARGVPAGRERGRRARAHRDRPVVPARAARAGARPGGRRARRPHLPRRRHLRGRVRGRDAVLLLGLGAAAGDARGAARRRGPA